MFQISKSVVQMYKEEMELKDGDALQLFVRYAGGSSGGYALGVNRGTPTEHDYSESVDGIIFFVKPDDQWFVRNMSLDYDTDHDNFMWQSPATA
jgi:uncharacterized protein YneR